MYMSIMFGNMQHSLVSVTGSEVVAGAIVPVEVMVAETSGDDGELP